MTEQHPEVQKFLKEIQSKGGKTTLARHGKEHYKEMRRKSGESKKLKKTVDNSSNK